MTARRVTLEVSVTGRDDALAAVRNGADRLELCAGLDCGGLTPSPGAFRMVRQAVAIPVYVLLRPRPGGFCYTAAELGVMHEDARHFLAAGADGAVAGVLLPDGRVDTVACEELVQVTVGRVVFHRAFDFTPDPLDALRTLADLGFERVQTSGQRPTALDGAGFIAELVRAAGDTIEVLPAGGIRPENVAQLLRETGCNQVHASLRGPGGDKSLGENRVLSPAMGAADYRGGYRRTDLEQVAAMRRELDRFGA